MSNISEILFDGLNEQGYLFQEKCEYVLKNNEKKIGWKVNGYEYPVYFQGEDTRIDIVLSQISNLFGLYAVVECKRADPSYVYWVFGKYIRSTEKSQCLALGFECTEVSTARPHKIDCLLKRLPFKISSPFTQSWLEVKRKSEKNNSNKKSSTPQNIEDAFRQILKGVGGFAHEQINQIRKKCTTFKMFFIPIVITTASLYVASYKPDDIDIATGKINKNKVVFSPQSMVTEEVPWVLVDYGIGENIYPNSIPKNYHGVDPSELKGYKTRTIFVVNSKNILDFFLGLRQGNKDG